VFIVTGEVPLNVEAADAAEQALAACIAQGPPRVVFNLQKTPLIDSRGLEILLDASQQCATRGGAMVLAAPNALCSDILRITGLGADFAVFDDVVSAVGSFAL
jgi:anti-anti-sigma factor